jgi:hypothetical protein
MVVSGFVSSSESRKATVKDLNRDGRPDIVVMGEGRRPNILRNTSVNGQTSFVDWTPAPAFPNSSIHGGWHAAVFDANGDKREDIMVGGTNDEHLFVHKRSNEVKDLQIGGVLPNMHNLDPLAVIGSALIGDGDSFTTTNIPSNAKVSVVMKSVGDVVLQIRNSGGTVIASSDRGGSGVEEAVQFTAPGGTLTFDVSVTGGIGNPAKPKRYLMEVLSRS